MEPLAHHMPFFMLDFVSRELSQNDAVDYILLYDGFKFALNTFDVEMVLKAKKEVPSTPDK